MNRKILLKEFLYMLAMNIIMLLSSFVQMLFMKDLGPYSGMIFSGTIYEYNPVFYIIGAVLFIISLIYGYRLILKDSFSGIRDMKIAGKILYFVIALVFSFTALLGELFVFLLRGWLDDIRPVVMLLITWYIWPISLFVFMVVMFVINHRRQSNSITEQ